MMHYNNNVVTIQDARTGNSFREYDHSRSGSVSEACIRMKFDTEYKFKFKFQDGGRRRLELFIDGTLVTDNLVVSSGSELERFIESDKRFKFVRSDNEAVADPTSRDNGKIEIRLYREIPMPVYKPYPLQPLNDEFWNTYNKGPVSYRGSSLGGLKGGNSLECFHRSSITTGSISADSVQASCFASSSFNDMGATVEGSRSDQDFGSTVWRGDCGFDTFIFHVKGAVTKEDINRFCSNCGNEFRPDHKFCSKCGRRV